MKSQNLKSPVQAQELTKRFILLLWSTTENEYDPDVIKDQISAMKDCIE